MNEKVGKKMEPTNIFINCQIQVFAPPNCLVFEVNGSTSGGKYPIYSRTKFLLSSALFIFSFFF